MIVCQRITAPMGQMRALTRAGGVFFAWSLAHYFAVHAYEHWCTPLTPIGFLMSPVMISSAHCTAFRWVIQQGALHVGHFWALLAGFVVVAVSHGGETERDASARSRMRAARGSACARALRSARACG